MTAPFITEESKEIITDAGTFRVTRRANLFDGEVLFTAYEPLPFMGSHYRYKKDETGWWGHVSDRRLLDDLDKQFEGIAERREAVEAYFKANRERAHAIIVQAFPEAKHGLNVMGAIVLPLDEKQS